MRWHKEKKGGGAVGMEKVKLSHFTWLATYN